MPTISSLTIYPLKSARGVDVERMELDEWGPRGDRRWMLVDDNDKYITLRHVTRLAFVEATLTPDGIRVTAPGLTPIEVAEPEGEGLDGTIVAKVWGDTCEVRPADAESSAALSEYLGIRCRLVHQPDESVRYVDRSNTGRITARRRISLNDGAPLLLTTEASLADLNGRLASPIPMSRFRPNVVVSNTAPFEEDMWHRITAGDVEFEVAKACPRCVATTVDQSTGKKGVEPLRTLETYRRGKDGVLFGQNVTHVAPGTISVGDSVRVID